WCPWCIKLDTNVFSTSEFAEFAAAELVLVKVDFPRKEQLSQEQSAANERLAKKYRVRGFPTLIILNSQGERVGSTGFRQESTKRYIEHLQGMME
ncbi:MAG: thioredoxin family protein, partial [Desulfuromonadaceae bacterium]